MKRAAKWKRSVSDRIVLAWFVPKFISTQPILDIATGDGRGNGLARGRDDREHGICFSFIRPGLFHPKRNRF